MDFVLVGIAALAASALTLFSGFGLGTLLMPVFAIFFPVPVAIAATAVVHLANNLFKLLLLGREANLAVVAKFGLPAALAALAGAALLVKMAGLAPVLEYEVFARQFEVTPVKLAIGLLILGFATLELSPAFARLALSPRYLMAGGLLSGFFGGLSGNQGALRAAFLIRAGLDKTAFVASSVVCAVIVDTVRLSIYGVSFGTQRLESLPTEAIGLVITASLAAFFGAFIGSRILGKITLRAVQLIVATGMMGIGAGLVAGWL